MSSGIRNLGTLHFEQTMLLISAFSFFISFGIRDKDPRTSHFEQTKLSMSAISIFFLNISFVLYKVPGTSYFEQTMLSISVFAFFLYRLILGVQKHEKMFRKKNM